MTSKMNVVSFQPDYDTAKVVSLVDESIYSLPGEHLKYEAEAEAEAAFLEAVDKGIKPTGEYSYEVIRKMKPITEQYKTVGRQFTGPDHFLEFVPVENTERMEELEKGWAKAAGSSHGQTGIIICVLCDKEMPTIGATVHNCGVSIFSIENNRVMALTVGAEGFKSYDFGPVGQIISDENGNNPQSVNLLPIEALDITGATFHYWKNLQTPA